MLVSILSDRRENDRFLLLVLASEDINVGGLEEFGEILELEFGAKLVEKYISPTLDYDWAYEVDGQSIHLTSDTTSDFEIFSDTPKGDEIVRRFGEVLKAKFRKKGMLREPEGGGS